MYLYIHITHTVYIYIQSDFKIKVFKRYKKKEPLIRMMPNLNGILLKRGKSVWHMKKVIPSISNRWHCTHPNLKGFDYK